MLSEVHSLFLPVKTGSVHCAVTSPPYLGQRLYGQLRVRWPACEYRIWPTLPPMRIPAWHGQLGQEPSPELYIGHIVLIMREIYRCLHPSGTLWLNMADVHWGGKGKSSQAWSTANQDRQTIQRSYHQVSGMGETRPQDHRHPGIKPKDLTGLPWAVAFTLRCEGWYLRLDGIWAKGRDGEIDESGYGQSMPGSQEDRPTLTHEYVFMLGRTARPFFDRHAVRARWGDGSHFLRSVWILNKENATRVNHFAPFPVELPEVCIRASTSEAGYCRRCGYPWVRQVARDDRLTGDGAFGNGGSKWMGQDEQSSGVRARKKPAPSEGEQFPGA